MTCLLWIRRDLRLIDNHALTAASRIGLPVIPVFIYGPEEIAAAEAGGAAHWWLHHSLQAFSQQLEDIGSRLIIRTGNPEAVIPQLIAETGALEVRCNRRYEPVAAALDDSLFEVLGRRGIRTFQHRGSLLFEPEDIRTGTATPYKVFTPWWRAAQAAAAPAAPLPPVRTLPPPRSWPASTPLTGLNLLPTIDWAAGLRASWSPGEAGASRRLDHAIEQVIATYDATRDLPANPDGVSRLSPHLHFGEVTARQVWHRILQEVPGGGASFRRQLGWRDFAHMVLATNPHTVHGNLDPRFDRFPWQHAPHLLRAWQQGQTGYPLVDAGMRELWHTGWMHNRVRMNVASFLVKHLRIHWRHGADWFADTLVDADLANNIFGWQWSAGCGADAAPYFRVFNPTLQSRKFDPAGEYLRRWLPELADLPREFLHAPEEAPAVVLARANVRLGYNYPFPVVRHSDARDGALAAWNSLKNQ